MSRSASVSSFMKYGNYNETNIIIINIIIAVVGLFYYKTHQTPTLLN